MIRINPSLDARSSFPKPERASDQLLQRASELVQQLAQDLSNCNPFHTQFDEVETALAALPLASEEFAVACCRLRNARNSSSRGERGAACYELRMLARSLFSRRR